MKNMLIFSQLCLTLGWMLSVDSMRIPWKLGIPLDMAQKSVDDMYGGCNNQASTDKIMNQYAKELTSGVYAQAWQKAKTCADQKYNIRSKEDMALTKDHMQAICVYTAIRILNPNGHCHTTYRRSGAAFSGRINQKICLGSFSSSSLRMDLVYFGRETCFKIKTCFGGYLKRYSILDNNEQEVLIPPYEMFTIINKIRQPSKIEGLEDCKVVYVLESAGHKSNLNCKLF